jgi:PKD repeat protein
VKIKSFNTWIITVVGCLLAGCNKAPVPVLSIDPVSGEVPLTVLFDGSKSYDPNGSISEFKWDFGDGSISYDQSIYHDFNSVGDYIVTFEVVDNKGKASNSKTKIVVTKPIVNQLELTRIDGHIGADNGTYIYRADLSKVNTATITSIIIYDDGIESSGMEGYLTGADIDALKISSSLCDNATCVNSAPTTIPLEFSLSNTIFSPGYQEGTNDFALYGTDASGFNLNNSKAKLEVFDGRINVSSTQSNGFISLGRRGAIAFNLLNPISPGSLYLYIGEVAGNEKISVAVSSSSINFATLIPNPKRQKRYNSCEAFQEYTNDHGVTDSNGENHPGASGWTDYQIRYSTSVSSTSTTTKTVAVRHFKCPCNNVIYNTLEECLENCQINLGCFTGICEPVDIEEEQVCVTTASSLMISFTVSTKVSMLDWTPSGTISNQCTQEIQRYTNETLNHEARHVQDIRDVVNSANDRLKNGVEYNAEGCGANEQEARNNLREKLNERAEQEKLTIQQEIDDKANSFHNSPESRITLPRCDKCRDL